MRIEFMKQFEKLLRHVAMIYSVSIILIQISLLEDPNRIDLYPLLACFKERLDLIQQDLKRYKQMLKYGIRLGQNLAIQPYKLLPDVKEFKIQVQGPDPIFKKHGLKKNLQPQLSFKRYTNKKMNRFVLWQVTRLNNCMDNPRKFWRIAESLIRSSLSFGLLSLHQIVPLWHRKHPLWYIKAVYREFDKIRRTKGYIRIDYKRVYIDKIPASKGRRPLGVPTLPWRLYLNLWNRMMSIFLYNHLSPTQHGFIPGRGTLTAWKNILVRLSKNPKTIFEYDLKNCFEQIRLDRIMSQLSEIGMPQHLIHHLWSMNSSHPKLPSNQELDESRALSKKELNDQIDTINRTWGPNTILGLRGLVNLMNSNPSLALTKFPSLNNSELLRYLYSLTDDQLDEVQTQKDTLALGGLPQGSPMSPLLTIFALSNTVLSLVENEKYADDGLLFDIIEDFSPEELNSPEAGVFLKLEASGFVKNSKGWLKELHFLGLIFNGWTQELRSSTHKGNSLKMDKWNLLSDLRQEKILNELIKLNMKDDKRIPYMIRKGLSWEDFANHKILGWITSRMYIGKWNDEEFNQNFHLTYTQGSWTDLELQHQKRLKTLGGYTGKGYELINLNIFNSSSIGMGYLRNWVTQERRLKRKVYDI